MTLSRTARILIAILLLAAAAFFWVNFFYRDGLTPVSVSGDPVNGANGSQAGIPIDGATNGANGSQAGLATSDGANGATNGADGSQSGIQTANGSADVSVNQAPFETISPENGGAQNGGVQSASDANGVAQNGAGPNGSDQSGVVQNGSEPNGADQNGNGGPLVVIPTPEVVTRDVEIADLPFLVTEPPAVPEEEEATATATTATGRQAAGQRISVNPFSPILIQAEAPTASTPPSTQAGPTITEVPIPGQGAVPGQNAGVPSTPVPMPMVAAPAPRPLAPPAPRADGLPRQLPGGQPLAATPDLLREARTVPELQPGDLGAVASLREPAGEARSDLAPVGVADDAPVADAPIQLLGPAARAEDEDAPAVPDAPMAAGVDPLSRYLRDNNVVFTGSVLGPVSVGVFRTTEAQTPLVVSLGQTLPETEIVLTDLTGMKAEFTLADSTQVLSLDLRR